MLPKINIIPQVLKPPSLNPGDNVKTDKEKIYPRLEFHTHKFTNRPKPENPKNIIIFSLFSEFGCETLAPLYCIPKLLANHRGKYSIVMGWYGREFLYKHLVDEYWELKEPFQHLREYCRAFHNNSANLKKLTEIVNGKFGKVITESESGSVATYPKLEYCPAVYGKYQCKGQVLQFENRQICVKCNANFSEAGLFTDVIKHKEKAVWLPQPSLEKRIQAEKIISKDNMVGVIARARKCYGRNLPSQFYVELITLLEEMGYEPIWMGEKAITIPCPVEHIRDISRSKIARDLELSLAIVSKLAFTVQFWTASTRLAGYAGIPFLLFESPDQLWGVGQEGYRLNLCTRGQKKIVVAHYKNVLEDQHRALMAVKESVSEMEKGNYRIKIGQVENEQEVLNLIKDNNKRVGF